MLEKGQICVYMYISTILNVHCITVLTHLVPLSLMSRHRLKFHYIFLQLPYIFLSYTQADWGPLKLEQPPPSNLKEAPIDSILSIV